MPGRPLSDAVALLCGRGLARLLGGWLVETLQLRLSSSVVPEFWSGLKQPENELEERGRAGVLLTAFRTLLDRLEPILGGFRSDSSFITSAALLNHTLLLFLLLLLLLGGLERLGSWQDQGHQNLCGPEPGGLQERAFTIIRALLLFSPAPVLQERVLEFYSRTFCIYMNQRGEAEDGGEVPDGPEGGVCRGCGVPTRRCWCQDALERLRELSHAL